MNIWSILFDLLKDMTDDYVDSAKEYLSDLTRRIYMFILMAVISILTLCFSIFALLARIADKLDDASGFIWMNSMTLYCITACSSLGILYYISNKTEPFHAPSLEKEIEETVRRHMEKRAPKKRKANARKSRR